MIFSFSQYVFYLGEILTSSGHSNLKLIHLYMSACQSNSVYRHVLCNLMHQMVCYTEQSKKLSMETVWKRTDTFKKYLAGDWMNHLSIAVLPCESAGDLVNPAALQGNVL